MNDNAISDLELSEDSDTKTKMKTLLAFYSALDICESIAINSKTVVQHCRHSNCS